MPHFQGRPIGELMNMGGYPIQSRSSKEKGCKINYNKCHCMKSCAEPLKEYSKCRTQNPKATQHKPMPDPELF